MKKKITLKQIARELDVSISTVSKSLRNSLEISEDTRQKVQAFAKFYNYKPNNIALSLNGKVFAIFVRRLGLKKSGLITRSSKGWPLSLNNCETC